MAEDWVQMRNPGLSDRPPSTVSRKSYDQEWKKRGWKLVKPAKKAKEE